MITGVDVLENNEKSAEQPVESAAWAARRVAFQKQTLIMAQQRLEQVNKLLFPQPA